MQDEVKSDDTVIAELEAENESLTARVAALVQALRELTAFARYVSSDIRSTVQCIDAGEKYIPGAKLILDFCCERLDNKATMADAALAAASQGEPPSFGSYYDFCSDFGITHERDALQAFGEGLEQRRATALQLLRAAGRDAGGLDDICDAHDLLAKAVRLAAEVLETGDEQRDWEPPKSPEAAAGPAVCKVTGGRCASADEYAGPMCVITGGECKHRQEPAREPEPKGEREAVARIRKRLRTACKFETFDSADVADLLTDYDRRGAAPKGEPGPRDESVPPPNWKWWAWSDDDGCPHVDDGLDGSCRPPREPDPGPDAPSAPPLHVREWDSIDDKFAEDPPQEPEVWDLTGGYRVTRHFEEQHQWRSWAGVMGLGVHDTYTEAVARCLAERDAVIASKVAPQEPEGPSLPAGWSVAKDNLERSTVYACGLFKLEVFSRGELIIEDGEENDCIRIADLLAVLTYHLSTAREEPDAPSAPPQEPEGPSLPSVVVAFTHEQFDDLDDFLRDCAESYRMDGEDDAGAKVDAYVAVLSTARGAKESK